jgi:lipoprotein-releasing system permease protein
LRFELKIALRYLRARRKEAFISITTILTAVGVMIGVAALTITLAVMGGLEKSVRERLLALTPQVQVVSLEGSIAEYAALQSRIASVAGINGTEAYIVGQGMISASGGASGVLVRGFDPTNSVAQAQWSKYVTEGSLAALGAALPAPSSAVPIDGYIAVGATLRDKLHAHMGETVRLISPIVGADGALTTRTAAFSIAAIFDSGMAYLDANTVFMDIGRAQNFFGRPGRADGIDVHLVNLDQTESVTAALRTALGRPYFVRNWIEFNRTAAGGFELLKLLYGAVLTVLIGVAAFNLVATLIMVVMEKRRDIAVLMSMGATRRAVRTIFILKGLIVGIAGTSMGLIVGAAGCFALARFAFIRLPREVYGVSTVPVAAAPLSFALVAIAAVTLCILAALYPARQASRETPVEIFRS